MKTTLSNTTAHPAPLETSRAPSLGTRLSQKMVGANRGVIFMVLSVLLFAGHTLLLRHLGTHRDIDFSLALLFRSVIGIIIVIALFPSRRPLRILPVFTEGRLIWRGIFGIIGTATFYWSIPQLGAGKATIYSNTYVLFGAVFAAIFLRETLSRSRMGWLAVAFIGLLILSSAHPGESNGLGFAPAVALLGALAAAATIVLIRQLTVTHSNATIFFSQCAWITIASLPLAIIRFEWPGASDLALLTAAAIMAGYGQLAMNQGFRLLNVAGGASILMALPVVTALGGFLFFGESFTPVQIGGAALLMAGTHHVATRKYPGRKLPPR
jgi:drug/metabolite transporter (DMT)-like permease